ncbi:MAG: hypothetical protein WCB02_00110 [Bradyrhizobium sp.]
MTNQTETPRARGVACSRCGTEFMCNPEGPCWCAEESARLPMPVDGEDCLCSACLRQAADQASSATTRDDTGAS